MIPGIYYSSLGNITISLSNMPEIFSAGFSMIVLTVSSTMRIQIIVKGGLTDSIYVRVFVDSWRAWHKYKGTVISS